MVTIHNIIYRNAATYLLHFPCSDFLIWGKGMRLSRTPMKSPLRNTTEDVHKLKYIFV